jgi:tetratricopeptide (TPR) repeat protein
MDNQRFEKALHLKVGGEPREAYEEFVSLANQCDDPIDKAGVLLYAGFCRKDLGEFQAAKQLLNTIKEIVNNLSTPGKESDADGRVTWLRIAIEFEEADISSSEGRKEEALVKFGDLLTRFAANLRDPPYRSDYERIQERRAYALADLARWNEALPILEEADSFKGTSRALINFYLGYCYVAVGEFVKGEQKLKASLELGLPANLEYRAHSALGKAYHKLKDYSRAKSELEKAAQTADPIYVRQAQLWKWLEVTCQHLGLEGEADRYRQLARPPS